MTAASEVFREHAALVRTSGQNEVRFGKHLFALVVCGCEHRNKAWRSKNFRGIRDEIARNSVRWIWYAASLKLRKTYEMFLHRVRCCRKIFRLMSRSRSETIRHSSGLESVLKVLGEGMKKDIAFNTEIRKQHHFNRAKHI